MDDNYKERVLPTKVFPKMPKIGQAEVDRLVYGEWAELPDLTKQPVSGIKTQPESAFEKAYKGLEDKIVNKSPLLSKPEGQKTMERRLPGSYMGTQKEQDDITELQALMEEAAGKQKNGTQADGMVYNMGNGNAGKVKLMNGIPQPTQPPQGTGSEGGASWQDEWNATPQYGDAGKPNVPTKTEIEYQEEIKKQGLEEINRAIGENLGTNKKRVQNGTIQVDVNGNWVDCKNAEDATWIKICGSSKDTSMTADGKALVAGGKEYPIYEPQKQGKREEISAPWQTVDSYSVQDVSVNPMNGFADMDLDNINYGTNAGGSVGSASAAKTGLIVEALRLGLSSVETVNYTVSLQKQNAGTPHEKTRAIVNVGSSDDSYRKLKLQAGKEYSMINDIPQSEDLASRNSAEITARNVYEKQTGEKADPDKHYDVKYSFDEAYLSSPYSGTMSKDEKGNVCYTPATSGINAYIVEYGWGGEGKRIRLG